MPIRYSNSRGDTNGPTISFFGMVGAVMAGLKLKEKWDAYQEVSTEEDGRRGVASYRDNDEEDGVALLDTSISARPKRSKSKGCCMCCGMNCGLFWKAFGIVAGFVTLWYGVKAVVWAMTPSPTGLENMPTYSTSLGCLTAPHLYNSSARITFSVPAGAANNDHGFDTRGSAVGTIVIAQGSPESTEIGYELTVRTDDASLLDGVDFHVPEAAEDGGRVSDSRVQLTTPRTLATATSCMRYDITMFVPPTLRELHVAAHTNTHVQFDPDAQISLEKLFVKLYTMSADNMILPHERIVVREQLELEVFRGWIVGDVAAVNTAELTTQRGDGVVNVRVHPSAASTEAEQDEPIYLRMTTGSGRTDMVYVAGEDRRPIKGDHVSARNGDMHLTYTGANVSGLLELATKSYTATGVHPIGGRVGGGGGGNRGQWTHWIGSEEGKDRIYVSSRGWAGIYF